MPNIKLCTFHNDDTKLVLETPMPTTEIGLTKLKDNFEVFSRILFDTVLDDKKEFEITYDEEAQQWIYLMKVS
jgi:hypothetical protein